MVVALGPGKFYGSSLPRPRFYTDVKLNDHRVDSPTPVLDPLMNWAEEAHWSMGGLSFTRRRLQGRIEGSVDKLRKQREKQFKEPAKVSDSSRAVKDKSKGGVGKARTPSPPPAPRVIKRRRVVGLVDEDDVDEKGVEETRQAKRGPVRKLGDDFERVARESGMVGEKAAIGTVAKRTRSKRTEEDRVVVDRKKKLVNKGGRKIGATVVAAVGVGTRTSPRLVKAGGSS